MKILVVDDNDLIRDRIASLLERIDGIGDLAFADDVDPAITAIAEFRPDLIILDIALKTGDGRRVLEHVNGAKGKTPVFILSNQANEILRELLLSLGATRYFDKSTEFEAMRDCILAMLEPTSRPA